jgi:hypothetical protein
MREIPESISQKIENDILKDLNPSAVVLWGKSLLSLFIGGGASLLVCEQFGVGFTSFAQTTGMLLHTQLNPVACTILCAVLFIALPPLCLRAMTSGLQFKVFARRSAYVGPAWLSLFVLLMSSHSHEGMMMSHNLIWLISASVFYQIFLYLLSKVTFEPIGHAHHAGGRPHSGF